MNNNIDEKNYIDKDLEDIRHYKGSLLQFKNFWEKKMKVNFNPHQTVNYKYPQQREEDDNSIPYQDFINGSSDLVKYILKTRKKEKINNKVSENFIESFDEFNNKFKIEEEEKEILFREKLKKLDDGAKIAKEKALIAKNEYEKFIKSGEKESADKELLKYNFYNSKYNMLNSKINLMQIDKSFENE